MKANINQSHICTTTEQIIQTSGRKYIKKNVWLFVDFSPNYTKQIPNYRWDMNVNAVCLRVDLFKYIDKYKEKILFIWFLYLLMADNTMNMLKC